MSNEPPPDAPDGFSDPPPDHGEGPPPDGGAGPPPGGIRYFFYYLTYLFRHPWVVLFVLITTVLMAILGMPVTFLPMVILEHFDDRSYVYWYLGFVLASIVVGAVVRLAATYLGAWLGERVVFLLRKDAFDRLERLNMLSVFSRGPGEFVQQLDRDVYSIRELLEHTLTQTLVDLTQGVAIVVAMFAMAPLRTAVVLAIFLVLGGLIRFFNVFVKQYAERARDLAENITGALIECIGGFRDIQASGRFPRFARRYQDQVAESARVNVWTRMWGEIAGLIPWLSSSAIVLFVYAVGLGQIESRAEFGEIITYTMLLRQLFPSVMAAAQWTTSLSMTMPSLIGLRSILDQPDPSAGRTDLVPLEPPVREIIFDQVCFAIDDQPLVEGLSFTIPGGKLTAIVGQSGAGKTTVFHLLLRLLEPTRGRILINGHSLSDLTMASVRARSASSRNGRSSSTRRCAKTC